MRLTCWHAGLVITLIIITGRSRYLPNGHLDTGKLCTGIYLKHDLSRANNFPLL